MARPFDDFERIARKAYQVTDREPIDDTELHPFDRRNLHPSLPAKVRKLFDDGYYADATFTACKFLDKVVQKHSGLTSESGYKLMMDAFNEAKPPIQLTALSNVSEIDEQKGFRFIFAGSVSAIRNPRGHEVTVVDDPDTCLDHLAFVSMLIRRLDSISPAKANKS